MKALRFLAAQEQSNWLVRKIQARQLAITQPREAVFSFFSKTTRQLSGAVFSPLAAWMPPSSPQGRVHGVSGERARTSREDRCASATDRPHAQGTNS
jgi:hypothetical protein